MTKTVFTSNDYELTNQGDPSLGHYDLDVYDDTLPEDEENRVRLTFDTHEFTDFLVTAHNLAHARLSWLKANLPDAKVEIQALAEVLGL